MRIIIRLLAGFILIILLISFLAAYIPPSASFLFAIAGLGFPIFWMSGLLMVVFLFIISEKWLSMLGSLILIISAPTFLHYFNLAITEKHREYQYSIFDFNTFGLKYPDTTSNQVENQKSLNKYLNSENFSVVCLQEYPMKGSKHAPFYKELDEGLHLPYKTLSHYFWDQKNTEYTLVTASRYLIIDEKVFTRDGLNFAMYSDIKFPKGTIRVYNIHFQSVKLTTERKLLMLNRHFNLHTLKIQVTDAIRKLRIAFLYREKQALMLAESIKSSPYPVIIAGDFNDTPSSFVYKTMKKGLKDATSSNNSGFKRTYKFSRFPLQIDYLLHSRSIKSGNFKAKRLHLSDHYSISSGFSFE